MKHTPWQTVNITVVACAISLSCPACANRASEDIQSGGEQQSASRPRAENEKTVSATTAEGPRATLADTTSPIDLRLYFPKEALTTAHRRADASSYSTYSYFPANDAFQSMYGSLFTLGNPGDLYVWSKGYNAGCVTTYAQLFLGEDKSFTEVGDYLANDQCKPSVALGYGNYLSGNDGLAWSAPGGLPRPGGTGTTAEKYGLSVRRQNLAGDAYLSAGALAWNQTRIVEVLPSYQPPYGRSQGVWGAGLAKTYSNVVRLVLYHGTYVPKQKAIASCKVDPSWAYSRFYYSLSGYHTYASEYYVAEGKWIIQESTLYIEDGGYWGLSDCIGLSLDKRADWVSYIDEI